MVGPDLNNLQTLFFIPALIAFFYVAKNRKHLKSKWNLYFRRARTVKVNLITRAHRNIEYFVVPTDNNMMEIAGGAYPFLREASIINAQYRIPEVWVSEGQAYPAIPEIIETHIKGKVKKPKEGGGFTDEDGNIPRHLVSFAEVKSMTLAGKTAQQIFQMLKSKIVHDIINASAKQMAKIDLMFYMLIILIVICAGGFYYLHQDLQTLKISFDTAMKLGAKP